MPTKIALKKTTPAPVLVEPRMRKKAAFAPNLWYSASEELTPNRRNSNNSSTNTPDPQHPHPQHNSATGRSGSVRRSSLRHTFRSSFLREWSARQDEEEEERMMALATDDIRASPR